MNQTKLTTNKISIDGQPIGQCSGHYIGNFYYNISINSIYILCQVGYKQVCLIGLDSANRYDEPVSVSDTSNISDSEFDNACNGHFKNFKLLSSVDITASI